MRGTAARQNPHRVVVFMKVYDTIAAISTPRGKGGIAVIRISGANTAAVLAEIFLPRGKSPTDNPRRACFGDICTPAGEVIDEGLVTYFAAPASFTGEDVAEISCHGGVLLTEAVLGAVLAAGARPAEAGEFTARAMMNGKMGLSSAEALGALLDAGNKGQLALARGGMEGKLADATREIYERLSAILSDIYAKVDFPDEDLNSMSAEELRTALAQVKAKTEALAATWQCGRAVSEGIETVICGPVNAGKSTLYNAIVGHDAAIVTDIAGTTRDVLTDTVSLGRVTLRLSDTAGLRESDDPVEQIGISRARRAVEEAELVFVLLDPRDPSDEDEALLRELAVTDKTVIRVYTKRDLCGDAIPVDSSIPTVYLSSVTGEGFDALRETVESAFIDGNLRMGEEAVVFSARQSATLSAVSVSLATAANNLEADLPYDICADDIREALSSLGELCGREMREDVITEIFSRFCVGK